MRSSAFGFALLLTFAAGAPAAAQSGRPAAVALFDEGRDALQRGDLDVACSKFAESNRLDPATGTAFNLANCEEQRGRLATAWVLFRQVVARMKPDDPRLGVANERLTALDARLPRVVFAANARTPAATRLLVDDVELAAASFGSAIPLDPGPHRAIIRSPGQPTRTTAFTLAAGETLTVPLSAPVEPTATQTQPAIRPGAAAAPEDRVLGAKRSDALLLTGAVGAAGLLVGAITGVIGLNAQAIGDKDCNDRTKTCSQEGHDANQRAKTLAVVSSVGFVVGILGGGTTTYLYFTTPARGEPQQATLIGLGGKW